MIYNRYRNKKVKFKDLKFDSKKELNRYLVLQDMQNQGEISNLELQVPIKIIIKGQKVCTYYADFSYMQDGVEVIEDVKSPITRKDPVYRLKKKLVKAVHNINIKET